MLIPFKKQFLPRFLAAILLSGAVLILAVLWIIHTFQHHESPLVTEIVVGASAVVLIVILWAALCTWVRKMIAQVDALQALFNIMPVGISILGPGGAVQEANKALGTILGLTPEQLRSGQFRSRTYLRSDGKPFLPDQFPSARALAEQREILGVELGVVQEDGEIVWTHVSAAPLPDGRVVTVTLDITERKRMEEELQLFRQQVDQSFDALYVVDPKSARILDVNERACEMLGYAREELLRLRIHDINKTVIDDAAWAAIVDSVGREGARVWESSHRRKDGRTVPVELSVRVHTHQGRSFHIAVARDITERKRTELDIRIKNNAIDASINGIAISDTDGILTYVNKTYVAMLGYDRPEELLGRPVADLSESSEAADRIFAALRKDGRWVGEAVGKRKDGTLVSRLLSASLVVDADGAATGVLGSFVDITERKQAEREREESEQRFRAVFDHAHDGMLVADTGTLRFILGNAKICAMLGYTAEELRKIGPADIHPQEALSLVAGKFQDIRTGRTTTTEDVPVIRKDGTVFFADISASPVELNGRLCAIGIFRDITERKRAEERYRQILQTAIDGFWIADAKGRLLEVNEAYCRMSGYNREELLQMHIPDVEAMELSEETARHIETIIARGYDRFETRHRRKDGTVYDVEVSTQFSHELGGMFFVFVQDITDRKRIEGALLQSEERLRRAQQVARIGSWELDIEHGTLIWSDEIFRIFELDPRVFKPSYEAFMQIIHPDDRDLVDRTYQASVRDHASYGIVHRLLLPDGRIKHVQEIGETSYDREGGAVRSFGTVQDVTERTIAADQLAASLREKETLLREIHHRVKNNLQVISSLLYFQAKKMKDETGLAALREGQDRLRSMILVHEKLYRSRDLANIDFGDYVRELAGQMLQSYAAIRGRVTVSVDVEQASLPIEIALPCGMIVNELVTNVFKYAFPGDQSGRATIRTRLKPGVLTLAVADTGVGFPQEVDTANPQTFGLQLVRNLAQQLGGSVTFERAAGTTVTVEIPVINNHRGGM